MMTVLCTIWGIGVAIALYPLSFCFNALNLYSGVTSHTISGNVWSMSIFLNILIFCGICGAVVGIAFDFWEYVKRSRISDLREEAAQLRIDAEKSANSITSQERRAVDMKTMALNVYEKCLENKKSDTPIVSCSYRADDQIDMIMRVLFEASEQQGKVYFISDKLDVLSELNISNRRKTEGA